MSDRKVPDDAMKAIKEAQLDLIDLGARRQAAEADFLKGQSRLSNLINRALHALDADPESRIGPDGSVLPPRAPR
jgi:hypothetical protein